jgi:acetolactate synthase-1/2/3 large subunit
VDFTFGVPAALRELHDLADVVLVLGAKLTHNGSAGFALPLDPRKLVHVDRSAAVLGANYPPRLGVVADLREFLPALVRECAAARGDLRAAGGWDEGLVARLRGVLDDARDERIANEPTLAGSGTWRAFFAQLGAAAPGELVVVTDTGLHQTLVRTHHRVKCPRGLISPSDFQSMGFGVPAAIGAALARPGASIVACVGDGAFLASGMDLLTAVREGVDLTVLVFHDGHYGVIRRQQLAAFGSASGVSLRTPDFEGLARSFGCGYVRPGSDRAEVFATLLRRPGVTLVELPMDDAAGLRVSAAKSLVREQVRRRLPRSVVSALKRLARRGG